MTEKETPSGVADELRRRAEKIARAKASRIPENSDELSPEATRRILHELRVHQVELEMQNEELRRAQEQLEISRARYFDLYDLAPVGYVTLSEKGMILEANLTIVTLLGVTRGALVKQPLTRFIVREDQDIHYRHRKRLLETGAPQAYEVRMARGGTGPFWARLEAIIAQDAGGLPLCLIAVSDITRRICAEQEVKILSARILEAQEEERRRIARDLHDGLGGLLSAIKYKFEAAQGPQEVREVIPFLQQAVDECRRIQMNLRPSLLDDFGLLATLNWLTREFEERRTGIRVEKQFEIEEGEIPPSLRSVIFRITQEALNNIFKHSGSSWVHLSLRKGNGTLQWIVRDDGRGFEVEKTAETGPDRGLGLNTMRERVEWSGGIFSIESRPGKGTTMQASWPGEPGGAGPAPVKNIQGPGKKKRVQV